MADGNSGKMKTFVTVEDMRAHAWSRSWLWAVKFEDGESQTSSIGDSSFTDWFPATEIEETIGACESLVFPGGFTSFEIPQSYTPHHISLTYIEPEDLKIGLWLNKWINSDIFSKDGIATLYEAVKLLYIARFDGRGEIVGDINQYWVYPTGAFTMAGSSGNSEPITNTIDLVICGKVGDSYTSPVTWTF